MGWGTKGMYLVYWFILDIIITSRRKLRVRRKPLVRRQKKNVPDRFGQGR
jgi:hypothetical protein